MDKCESPDELVGVCRLLQEFLDETLSVGLE